MKCCRVLEMLSSYIDGILDEQSLELVESHLAECAECNRELEYLRIMLGAASEIEQVQPPVGLKGGIMEAISETDQQCIPVMGMLSTYVDSELSPKQQSLVITHIMECEACAEELAALKDFVEAAASITQLDPPLGLRAIIMTATTGKEVTRIPFGQWLGDLISPRAFRWAGGSVAAALLAIGVMLGISHSPTLVRQARIEQESSNSISSKLTPVQKETSASLEAPVNTQSRENAAPARMHKKHRINREKPVLVAAAPLTKPASSKPSVKPASKGKGPDELGIDTAADMRLAAMEPTEVDVVSEVSSVDKEQAKRKIHEELVKVAVADLVGKENTDEWLKEAKNMATTKNGQNNASLINVKF